MADWGRRSDTRDPCIILMEKQERTCKGCKYRMTLWGVAVCSKKNSKAVRRCGQYKEVD